MASTGQRLAPDDVGELRGIASRREALPLDLPELTLAAAVELACTGWVWRSHDMTFRQFESWVSRELRLAEAWRALTTDVLASPYDYAPHEREMRTISDADAASRLADRFRKSLIEHGRFDPNLARGLAGALGEMTDNVLQHGSPTGEPAARGIAGYEVRADAFEFAVGDVGQGALTSLRENPVWAGLASNEEALDAIIMRGASRRLGQGAGAGFSSAVRALAELGALRIRTGDRHVAVETASRWAPRTAVKGSNFQLVGLTVSAMGARRP